MKFFNGDDVSTSASVLECPLMQEKTSCIGGVLTLNYELLRLGALVKLRVGRPCISLTARNTASSFAALIWLNLLALITIPIYINVLGVSEWGLVAACASLQILLNFVDAGLGQIVPRWVAREADHSGRLRQHVNLFKYFYVVLGLGIFILLQIAASFLAHEWFKVSVDKADALELAIRIVSFQFLFQFVNNIHIGLWNGLQRQVLANLRACGFGTFKHVTALTALLLVAPQAWVYALAFAFVACVECCANALSVRSLMNKQYANAAAEKVALVPLLKDVSVLSGGILVGVLVSQIDRIILSRTVDVGLFGIYTTVSTLALAFLQLQVPVTRACFPLLAREIYLDGRASSRLMRKMFAGTLITCAVPALLTSVFASEILNLWLNDPIIVRNGSATLRMLLIAIAVNSLYGCIYQIIVAKGLSHIVLKINLICLVGAALAVYLVGSSYGILLGSTIWLTSSTIQLFLGAAWLIRSSQCRPRTIEIEHQ
jgi:O-antigen/teichoic acid export membrane protein